jgi:chromosome segregation ATPase
VKEERMMTKAGARWLYFFAGFFVMGFLIGGGGSAWGQEAVAADAQDEPTPALSAAVASPLQAADEESAPVELAAEDQENSPSPISPREKVQRRLEAIQDLPLGELKEKLAEIEALLPALNQQLGDASRVAQETRETAADNSPEIKELYIQIRALHERIAALTETLPEVQEQVTAQTAIRSELLGEMEFRTQLVNLIRRKEAAEATRVQAEELP